MHQGEGGGQPRVLQVAVVHRQVGGQHHAFVDQGAGRQRGDVEAGGVGQFGPVPDGVVHLFAEDEQFALEGGAGGGGGAATEEHLAHQRFGGLDAVAQAGVVGGDLAPAEQGLALGFRDLGKSGFAARQGGPVARQEDHPDGVVAQGRQRDTQAVTLGA